MAKPLDDQATEDLAIVENRIEELRTELKMLRKLAAKIRSSRNKIEESELSDARKNHKNDPTLPEDIAKRYE